MKTQVVILAVVASIVSLSESLAQDFVFTPTEIAPFQFGGQTFRLWASLKNVEDNPRQWQFRYDPPFLPEADQEGRLNTRRYEFGGKWRVDVPVFLDGDEIRKRAIQAVRETYPDQANLFRSESIFAIPLRNIRFDFPDGSAPAGVTLITRSLDFATPPREFVLTFEAPMEDGAKSISEMLPNLRLNYSFSISAKRAKQNYFQVKMAAMRRTALHAKLKDLGTTTVYIHRDDLRKLSESFHTEIEGLAVIEAPESFNKSIFEDLALKFQDVTTSASARWNEEKWKSTYNADDLKPDKITKTLDKMFKKNQGEEEWHYDIQYEGEGKGSFLDILSAEAKAKGKFKKDELKKWLNEHSVHAEFEGEKWVAKVIDLKQVNLADFNNDAKFVNAMTFITGDVTDVTPGHLYFAQSVATKAIHPDLSKRIGNLESATVRLVPVGTVLDWYRPDAATLLPEGFRICDGSVVEDRESIFYGKKVPSLTDRFVMGVPPERSGEVGGTNRLDLAHSHKFSFQLIRPPRDGWLRMGVGDINVPHDFSFSGDTGSGLTNVDSRPQYFGLIKLIRVK